MSKQLAGARPGTGSSGLSIGAMAELTGVSIPVLRAWEQRFGFPDPERVPSGHRRYSRGQVEQVRAVVRDRDAGWSLEAAIDRARHGERRVESSLFAGVRRRRPDLAVHELSLEAMLAISHAIEDECCARGDEPVLFGSFERVRFFRRSEPRWCELARTAALAIVFADFDRTRVREGAPVEVALTHDAPLLREWAVVCDARDATACLIGVERPSRRAAGVARVFEAVWSFEPGVVRDAVQVSATIARVHAPQLGPRLDVVTASEKADPGLVLRRAGALAGRVVSYLDR